MEKGVSSTGEGVAGDRPRGEAEVKEARWVYERRKNIACSFMALRRHGLLRLLIPPFPIDPFTAVFSAEVTSNRLSATRSARDDRFR